jgi:tetratricopeptide (TPR) repeat protein
MDQNFEIRWDRSRVTIGNGAISYTATGKYADFLSLLISIDPETMIDRSALCQLESWSANLPMSAGKQVARFISTLNAKGLAPIAFLQRTDGWALAPQYRQALDGQTVLDVQSAIAARGVISSSARLETLLNWYHANFRGMVAMSTGKASEGYLMLRDSMNGMADDMLFSISNVLATRIEQRLDTPKLPVFSSINLQSNMFGRAIEMRRFAAYALHAKSENWPEMEKIFRRHLAAHLNSGDFTTIAILHNALGVLLRRMGKIDAATEQLRLAAPLAIFSGDIILAQNVAFNLANIASEASQMPHNSVDPQTYLSLLEFDAHLRATTSIGRDSAQTELLLAELFLARGEFDQVEHFLMLAERIIMDTRLVMDEALHCRLSALLLVKVSDAKDGVRKDALDLLNRAKQLYAQAGLVANAAAIDEDILSLPHPEKTDA